MGLFTMWDSCLQENLTPSLKKELMKWNTIFKIWLWKGTREGHITLCQPFCTRILSLISSFFYNVTSWFSINHRVLTEEIMGSKNCFTAHLFCQYHEQQAVSQLHFFYVGKKCKSMSTPMDGSVHVGAGKECFSLQMSYLEQMCGVDGGIYLYVCITASLQGKDLGMGTASGRLDSHPRGMMRKRKSHGTISEILF